MGLAGMYPGENRGFFVSGFDMSDKIVVDFDVPDLAPVLDLALPDVNAPDKPQERRAVKFLQSGVVLNQLHPLLDIIRLLLVCLQFARQTPLLLQLLGALRLVQPV